MEPLRCVLCLSTCSPEKCKWNVAGVDIVNDPDERNEEDSLKHSTQMEFLLRKLLKIPEDICRSFNSFDDLNSAVNCCDSCSSLTEDAQSISNHIKLLQERYEKLQNEVKNTILQSVKAEIVAGNDCNEDGLPTNSVSDTVRSYFRNGLATSSIEIEMKTEVYSNAEFEEPDEYSATIESQNSPFGTGGNQSANYESYCTDSIFGDEVNDKLHKCSVCGIEFVREDLLQDHFMQNHTKDKDHKCQTLKCETCGKCFSTKKSFKCKICGECFPFDSSLQAHIEFRHPVKRTIPVPTISKGVEEESDEVVTGFTSTYDLNAAVQTGDVILTNGRYSGTEKRTTSASDVRVSENARQKDNPEKLDTCTICGKAWQGFLQDHLKTHTGMDDNLAKRARRENVEERVTKPELNIRRNVANSDGTADFYKCGICGKVFKGQCFIQVHMKTHAAEMNGRQMVAVKLAMDGTSFTCYICSESFVVSAALQSHMKTHNAMQL